MRPVAASSISRSLKNAPLAAPMSALLGLACSRRRECWGSWRGGILQVSRDRSAVMGVPGSSVLGVSRRRGCGLAHLPDRLKPGCRFCGSYRVAFDAESGADQRPAALANEGLPGLCRRLAQGPQARRRCANGTGAARFRWARATGAIVSIELNGGPARTRTEDQGIMSPLL